MMWKMGGFIVLLLVLNQISSGQQGRVSELHASATYNLGIDYGKTDTLWHHRFRPARAVITGYTLEGKEFKLNRYSILQLLYVRTGNWRGYNGKWLEFWPAVGHIPKSNGYFIPLTSLQDLDSSMVPKTYAQQNQPRKIPFSSTDEFAIGVVAIVFLFIVLVYAWAGRSSGGVSGGSGISSSRPEELFYSNGSFKRGVKDQWGHYKETSTQKCYRPDGTGNYTEM